MCLSIPKVNPPIDTDNTVESKVVYKNIGEELSITELSLLVDFLKHLLKAVCLPDSLPYVPTDIELLLQSMEESVEKKQENISTDKIENALKEMAVDQSEYSLYCKIANKNGEQFLLVEFQEKK